MSTNPSFLVLAIVLVLAPFPLGSLNTVWVGFWIVALSLALLLTRDQQPVVHRSGPMLAVYVASVAYALVAIAQTVGWSFPPPEPALPAAGREGPASVPADNPFTIPDAGIWHAAPAVASLLALVCGVVIAARTDRAVSLLRLAALSALVWAAVGLAQWVIDPGHVLWVPRPASSRLSGTFLNPNTAATYHGCATVIFVALAGDALRREISSRREDFAQILRYVVVRPPGGLVLYGCAAAFALVATIVTGSRAGMVATAMGVFVVIALTFRSVPVWRRWRWGVLAVSAVVVFGGVMVFGGEQMNRVDATTLLEDGRADIYRSTVEMILRKPWMGHGLGAFEFAYPAFRAQDVSIRGIMTRAHSVPLQLAVDLGIVVAALVLVACVWIAWVLLREALTDRRRRVVPIATFAVLVVAYVHGLVDFSLQIPGFAIVFWLLIGAGLGNALIRPLAGDGERSREGSGQPRASSRRASAR